MTLYDVAVMTNSCHFYDLNVILNVRFVIRMTN